MVASEYNHEQYAQKLFLFLVFLLRAALVAFAREVRKPKAASVKLAAFLSPPVGLKAAVKRPKLF